MVDVFLGRECYLRNPGILKNRYASLNVYQHHVFFSEIMMFFRSLSISWIFHGLRSTISWYYQYQHRGFFSEYPSLRDYEVHHCAKEGPK